MSIKLEAIDELRKRANVNYEDAKVALEKCNGDMVEALIYLERQNKTNGYKPSENSEHNFWHGVKKLIKKGNKIKFIIKKGDNVVIALPLTLVIIFAIIPPHISIIGAVIALITGHKIKFEDKNGEAMNINKHIEKVSEAVDIAKKKIVED